MKEIQYPSIQQPVRFAAPAVAPTWFMNDTQQTRPRRWAQQPPSVSAPVMSPLLFVRTPPHVETLQVQVRPRRWAQQPSSYSAPVMVITSTASRRRQSQII